MKKKRVVIIAVVFLFLIVATALGYFFRQDLSKIAAKILPGPRVKVLDQTFGVLVELENGKRVFNEADKVVISEDAAYGWIIAVETEEDELAWEEIVVFPEKPKNLEVTEETKISGDGKIAVTRRVDDARNGLISNFWGLSKDDPTGKYDIKVYSEGKLLGQFVFEVME